jgi:hypothetical protein
MLTLLLVALMAEAPEPPSIEQMKLDEVLSCSGDPTKCDASDWELAWELARRFGTKELSSHLKRASEAQRRVLVFSLYASPSNPDVAKLMKKFSNDPDEEIAYYALNYRAKLCDQEALAKLVAPSYDARASCQQWAVTVSLVGQCKYKPGGRFLVEHLDYACLNIVLAAVESLRALYPDAPSFESPAQVKAYFEKRVGK